MCDLLWSDPDDRCGWGISPRGAGYTFGQVTLSLSLYIYIYVYIYVFSIYLLIMPLFEVLMVLWSPLFSLI